jgi:hypothetical protein
MDLDRTILTPLKVTHFVCLVVEQGGMALYEGTHEIVFWRGSGTEVTFPVEVKEQAT